MGKGLKYVSEFTFPSDKGYSASAGKTMVKAYARGGAADVKQDKAMVKAAVQKHERAKHPGEPLTKMANGGMVTHMGPGSGKAPPANNRPMPAPSRAANPFANARPSSGGANPFANARVGSNTGQRYTPPPQQPQGRPMPTVQDIGRMIGSTKMANSPAQPPMQNPQGMTRDQRRIAGEEAERQAARAAGNDPLTSMARAREANRIASQTPGTISYEMAKSRGQPGYKKGGAVTKAPAAPAPKSDMLYSKKEVNAKNLLPGGKAPSLPRARGSVNMAKGGATCMAKGGKK
jgi:hypothetical protein